MSKSVYMDVRRQIKKEFEQKLAEQQETIKRYKEIIIKQEERIKELEKQCAAIDDGKVEIPSFIKSNPILTSVYYKIMEEDSEFLKNI